MVRLFFQPGKRTGYEGVVITLGDDFEREREEFIRRSSHERDFFDYYIGRPHPAMIGGGRPSRAHRRAGLRARGTRLMTAWVLITAFALSLLVSVISTLMSR